MLKCNIDKREKNCVVEASGSTMELCMELTGLIGHLYQALSSNSVVNGVMFKSLICAAVASDKFWDQKRGGDDDIGLCRRTGDAVNPAEIEKLMKIGATPEQIARYYGGVE